MRQPLSLQVRARLKPYFAALAGFSLASNLLLLVSPFYMLQVYDRILSSGSTDTLIWLTALAVMLLVVYGAAEGARRRICALAGVELENLLVPKIFARFEAGTGGAPALSQDLALSARIQSVFQAGSVLPFIDLPFAPIFLIALFLVHPLLGALGVVGAVIVFGVAVTAEMTTRDASKYSQVAMTAASEMAAGLERQHSAMVAMGLVRGAFSKWQAAKLAGQNFALQATKADGKFHRDFTLGAPGPADFYPWSRGRTGFDPRCFPGFDCRVLDHSGPGAWSDRPDCRWLAHQYSGLAGLGSIAAAPGGAR